MRGTCLRPLNAAFSVVIVTLILGHTVVWSVIFPLGSVEEP